MNNQSRSMCQFTKIDFHNQLKCLISLASFLGTKEHSDIRLVLFIGMQELFVTVIR